MATILIVDDDAALREGLAETLGDLGHRTEEAGDDATALRRLARRGVDAVLLDLRMPGMEVWKCCAASAPCRRPRRLRC